MCGVTPAPRDLLHLSAHQRQLKTHSLRCPSFPTAQHCFGKDFFIRNRGRFRKKRSSQIEESTSLRNVAPPRGAHPIQTKTGSSDQLCTGSAVRADSSRTKSRRASSSRSNRTRCPMRAAVACTSLPREPNWRHEGASSNATDPKTRPL